MKGIQLPISAYKRVILLTLSSIWEWYCTQHRPIKEWYCSLYHRYESDTAYYMRAILLTKWKWSAHYIIHMRGIPLTISYIRAWYRSQYHLYERDTIHNIIYKRMIPLTISSIWEWYCSQYHLWGDPARYTGLYESDTAHYMRVIQLYESDTTHDMRVISLTIWVIPPTIWEWYRSLYESDTAQYVCPSCKWAPMQHRLPSTQSGARHGIMS